MLLRAVGGCGVIATDTIWRATCRFYAPVLGHPLPMRRMHEAARRVLVRKAWGVG